MFGWSDKKTTSPTDPADFAGTVEGLLITGQCGFVFGTCLATDHGWRSVDELSVGDKVLTFDHGMRTLYDIQRDTLFDTEHALSAAQRPILVPEGRMNNRSDIWLMPDQGMLVETDVTTDTLGDPFAVIPARSLKGLRGIRSVPSVDKMVVTTLAFAKDEVVYIEGGMLAYCPHPRNILMEAPNTGADLYRVMDIRAARYLVECLIEDNNGDALICDPDEIAGVSGRTDRRARPLPILS